MKIAEQFCDTLEKEGAKLRNDKEFNDLIDEIDALKEEGILKAPKYKIPPLDTIGIRNLKPGWS